MASRARTLFAGLTVAAVLASGPAMARQAGVASAVNPDAVTEPPAQPRQSLIVGHDVVFNEKITTGPKGQAQLLMLDQSGLTVAANSELVIDRFVYDPDANTGEMALNLTRGLVRFVGGRLSKSGSARIRTPVATMGVRGGIALVDVISPTVTDVTLLFGDSVTGETNEGQPFRLRRHGYFTRIEAGIGASAPQPLPSGALAGALSRLQGRAGATGGATEKPTEEGAAAALGAAVTEAATLDPDIDFQIDAVGDDGFAVTDLIEADGGAGEVADNLFDVTNFGFGQGRQDDTLFDAATSKVKVLAGADAEQLAAPGAFDASNFAAGTELFTISGAGGLLAAEINEGALNFSLNGIGDPDAVPNIFNAADATLFLSADTFNAQAQAQKGAALANAIAAQNVHGSKFFKVDVTSPDFNGVVGSRLSLVGGAPLTETLTGQSFFEPTGDTQTISKLPFSEIGAFELPIAGVAEAETRTIDPANVTQTPIIIDWDKGKVLYVGGIFQNLGAAESVYGIQAIAGNVIGGAGADVRIAAENGGGSHIFLNGQEFRTFHAGAANGGPLGDPADGIALVTGGGHTTLEPDGAPTSVVNLQFGKQTQPIDTGNAGVGVQTETLFVGAMIDNEVAEFENLVSDPNVAGGVGTLTVDRNNGELASQIRVIDELGGVNAVDTGRSGSAFLNDDLFAIVESSGDAFAAGEAPAVVLVSGDAVGAPNPCVCAFMHWGLIAFGQAQPGEISNDISDIGGFFAGVATPDIDMPISGGGTYVGQAYASLLTTGAATPTFATGAFNLNVDFGDGVGVGAMNLNAEAFTVVSNHTPGQAAIAVDYLKGANIVGAGNGLFIGPAADNLGVTININDGVGLRAAGVAVADKQ